MQFAPYGGEVPRAYRIQAPDVLYHVGSRGVDRQPVFGRIPFDREHFITLLGETVRRHRWNLHAYCLMGNHFHLVLDTPDANLSAGMQYLKGSHAQWFNRFKPREGTLFERRFWDRIAASEAYALELARYVVLNPVRAGLVRSPEEWPWSSYAATAGFERPPAFLKPTHVLNTFGGGIDARARFVRFVRDGLTVTTLSPGAEGVSDGV